MISYVRFQLSLNYFGQSIILTIAALPAIMFFIDWLRSAKIMLGVLIIFGCIPVGFTTFNLLMDVDENVSHWGKPTLELNNDAILYGPLPALFFLLMALICFFDMKEKEDLRLEKYFSYAIFFAIGITFGISAYLNLHLR